MRVLLFSLLLISSSAFAAETADLKIKGMTCGACVQAVTKAICKNPSVATCEIKVGSAHLVAKDGAKLDLPALEQAIVDTGFEVEKPTALKK